MSYEDYNILIVDDDSTLGESLKEAISRAGFSCHLAKTGREVFQYIEKQEPHIILTDLLLPDMDGLSLIEKLNEISEEVHILCMTGVFKENEFIRNIRKNKRIKDFLLKPFDIQKLVKKIKELVGDGGKKNFIIDSYIERSTDKNHIIKKVNQLSEVHGFDLIWIMKLLLDCKAFGCLTISYGEDKKEVIFSNGNIINVNFENKKSILPLLLVEKNYIAQNTLDKFLLKSKNKEAGKALKFLVNENLLSPHLLDSINKDYLEWKLGKLIRDLNLKISFLENKEMKADGLFGIDNKDAFTAFSIKAIENIGSCDWLKNHYFQLFENKIMIKPEKEREIKKILTFSKLSPVYSSISYFLHKGTTIEELIAKDLNTEKLILKAIHFMNIMGFIKFKMDHKHLNFSYKIKRLEKLNAELENKDYFQRLGVKQDASEAEIKAAYLDLAKNLHPDKLGEHNPEEILRLSKAVFSKIQDSYDTLKKLEERKKYIKKLEMVESEKYIQADFHLQRGMGFMRSCHYSSAKTEFAKAVKLNSESIDFKIYLLWSEFKITKKLDERAITKMEEKLEQVPIESRDSFIYHHVRGIHYKLIDEIQKAKAQFKMVLKTNPDFIDARRELANLKEKFDFSKILKGDIKEVVGLFLKR